MIGREESDLSLVLRLYWFMSKFNQILAILVWVFACIALGSKTDSFTGFLFIVPFTLGPHAVSHALCFRFRCRVSAILLAIGMAIYAAWFFFVFVDVFYIHPDPQSPIALLFVGAVSLPVMIPVWVGAVAFEKRANVLDEKVAGVEDSERA